MVYNLTGMRYDGTPSEHSGILIQPPSNYVKVDVTDVTFIWNTYSYRLYYLEF